MQTSVILRCTDAGRSALQVLILPGNPGSAGYYEAYIAALHTALHGQADIHAVSHLGHASSKKARQNRKTVFLTCFDASLMSSMSSFRADMLNAEKTWTTLCRPSAYKSRSTTRLPMCSSTCQDIQISQLQSLDIQLVGMNWVTALHHQTLVVSILLRRCIHGTQSCQAIAGSAIWRPRHSKGIDIV